jgi:hypothetical protein
MHAFAMRRSRRGHLLALLGALPLLGAGPSGRAGAAPAPAPADHRPTGGGTAPRSAEAILADAVEATGGDAPWRTHRSMELKTEIEYRKMAITATRTQLLTAKNKSFAVTRIPNVGTITEGTNGKVVWAEDPVNGLRRLEGAEAEQARVETTWNAERHLAELFKKVDARRDSDAGRPLDCLELTPESGPPRTSCYDAVTHLQVLQKGMAATPQGDVPFTSRIKSWKDYGGVKMPAVVDMVTGPIEFTARLVDVAFDKPVDEKIFELPASKAPGKAGAPARHKAAPSGP